jgi:peptidoglycan DL-endopeptidase CwlO
MATTTTVTGAEIVNDARRYLGIPYVFGGGPANPRAGLDCSGLIERVAFDVGIHSCPRTSEEQWTWSEHVNSPGAGDLVFFVGADGEPGNPGHVGIVVQPGTMIDAPHTGTVVQQSGYSNGTGENLIVGYGRMRGATGSTSANLSYAASDSTGGSAGGTIAGVFGFLGIVLIFGIIIALLAFGIYLLIM